MVTYQFEVDEEEWDAWKNTVPRTKALDERIRELIRADTEGRVQESEHTEAQQERTDAPEPTEVQPDKRQEAREILNGLDLPGSGSDYEQRVESVLVMYDLLRSNPGVRMSKSDFEEALEGKDVGYSGGFGSLWSNWVKSNPAQGHGGNVLEQLPGVELRSNSYVYRD
jgi:hypothetical protein